jgi:hypothetical protein
MALVEARIHTIPEVIDRIHTDVAYDWLLHHEVPGFITRQGIVKSDAKFTNSTLVERSAAWLSLQVPPQPVRARCIGPGTAEDIGPHLDGNLHLREGLKWRTQTVAAGRAMVWLATMSPEFIPMVKGQELSFEEEDTFVLSALKAARESSFTDELVDDSICQPDIYVGTLNPGDSVTFCMTDSVHLMPVGHDFVTLGDDLRIMYEGVTSMSHDAAATIEGHGKLLERAQPAV